MYVQMYLRLRCVVRHPHTRFGLVYLRALRVFIPHRRFVGALSFSLEDRRFLPTPTLLAFSGLPHCGLCKV